MCERLKQAVLKTALPERVTGVRIPLPPPSESPLTSTDIHFSVGFACYSRRFTFIDVQGCTWKPGAVGGYFWGNPAFGCFEDTPNVASRGLWCWRTRRLRS